MNTLSVNRYTEAWRAFGASVHPPSAVLVISAHWYTNATAVTSMAHPRTIHDFYGFPDELFAFEYPAPGSPEIAELVAETVRPRYVGLDLDSWGLDHGAWSVLAHLRPAADVPVVQLSINASESFDFHYDIGSRLAPLRDRNVLIIGSGNIVHNLGRVDWEQPDVGFDWARRFDDAARALLIDDPGDLLALRDHPDFALAVPTDDHFIPLLYVAALAAANNEKPEVLIDGYAYGALSMTCITAGITDLHADPTRAGAGEPPGPDVVPPDQSNI
jgi:4,5-DOPA dioxygenase extradiol